MRDKLKISNNMKARFKWEYLYVFLFLIKYAFYNTRINFWDSIQTLLTVALIVIYLIDLGKKKELLRTLIVHLIALFIGLISYYITGMSLFLLIILLYLLIEKKDIFNLIRLFLVIRTVSLIIVVLCSITGIVSNVVYHVYKSGTIITLRAYGFNHPNQLAQAIASVCMATICLNYKRKRHLFLLVLILMVMNYYITKSRSALICTGILLLLSVLLNKKKINDKGKQRLVVIFSCFYILFFVAGIVFPILMNICTGRVREIIYYINGLIGSRFSFANAVLSNYHITLFGNTFDFTFLEHLYGNYAVDNSYINVLFNFGILAIVFYALTTYFSMKSLIKNNYYILASYILVVLLWGNFENILFNISINMSLLFIGTDSNFRFRHLKIKI